MTQGEASREAREIADREGIAMVVTFNPYDERTLEDRDNCYGYMPKASFYIVAGHETVVETIGPHKRPTLGNHVAGFRFTDPDES